MGLLGFAVAAGLSATTQPTPAQEFGFGYWSNPGSSKAVATKKQKQAKRAATLTAASNAQETAVKPDRSGAVVADVKPSHPLVLVVSLRKQRVTVYDGDKIIAHSPISSGRVGNPTPLGVFSILEKRKIHFSNLYDSAPMPNMHRITWSGVALHAGVLPGYPASHGCIRLPHSFSKKLFDITKNGQRVIVTRDDTPAKSFAHPALFETYPDEIAIPATNQKVADASGLVTAAVAATTETGALATGSRRSKFREAWLAEMAKLTQAVTDSAAELEAAKLNLIDANRAETSARDALKAGRVEAQARSAAAKKANSDRLAAEKALDEFAKTMLKEQRLSDEAVLAAAEREETLDADVSKRTDEATTATEAEAEIASAVATLEADATKADKALKAAKDRLATAETGVKTSKAADEAAKRREAKRKNPVAIFISRQTQKLYVRQGQEPILESTVTFTEPDRMVGTHVFTAISTAANDMDMNWTVVSVPTPPKVQAEKVPKKDRKAQSEPVAAPAANLSDQTASNALDRITIPAEVREQIADIMKPGSSLIVSDFGISNETGPFTDIIVPLR